MGASCNECNCAEDDSQGDNSAFYLIKKQSLFNYRLQGIWDESEKAIYEGAVGLLGQYSFNEYNIGIMRQQLEPVFGSRTEEQQNMIDSLDIDEITIDGRQYGSENATMRIYACRQKTRMSDHSKAIIYFHGGAVIMLSAEQTLPVAARIAIDAGCTVFAVDFRNAPEAKAPESIQDCYAATKYICSNAQQLGVDRSRIALHGENGGGYLCAGVSMMLASRNEGQLIKCVIPDIPMLNCDAWVSQPKYEVSETTIAARQQHVETLRLWSTNFDLQCLQKDPHLFPAQMSDELLKKVPPHVVMTREFDQYRHDAEFYAQRLRQHGKLLDLYIHPGSCHYSFNQNPQVLQDTKKIFDTYV